MDEEMTWALDGQLAPTPSAVIFRRTIDTCYAVGDYRRASEWMDAIADCFARTGIEAFPGDCEATASVSSSAAAPGQKANDEPAVRVPPWNPNDLTHVGLALAEIGEIRWRRGDLAGADEAFTRAMQLGSGPHPGMALVRLAQGDVRGAVVSIAAALADETWGCLARARLLPAQSVRALACQRQSLRAWAAPVQHGAGLLQRGHTVLDTISQVIGPLTVVVAPPGRAHQSWRLVPGTTTSQGRRRPGPG